MSSISHRSLAHRFLCSYPQPQATPGCTYTSIEFPHFDMSPTSTVYQSTVVATQTVDCGGCTSIAVETQKLGVGPVRTHRDSSFTQTSRSAADMNCPLRSVKSKPSSPWPRPPPRPTNARPLTQSNSSTEWDPDGKWTDHIWRSLLHREGNVIEGIGKYPDLNFDICMLEQCYQPEAIQKRFLNSIV